MFHQLHPTLAPVPTSLALCESGITALKAELSQQCQTIRKRKRIWPLVLTFRDCLMQTRKKLNFHVLGFLFSSLENSFCCWSHTSGLSRGLFANSQSRPGWVIMKRKIAFFRHLNWVGLWWAHRGSGSSFSLKNCTLSLCPDENSEVQYVWGVWLLYWKKPANNQTFPWTSEEKMDRFCHVPHVDHVSLVWCIFPYTEFQDGLCWKEP